MRVDGDERVDRIGVMHDELPCLDLLEATPAILRGLMSGISDEEARWKPAPDLLDRVRDISCRRFAHGQPQAATRSSRIRRHHRIAHEIRDPKCKAAVFGDARSGDCDRCLETIDQVKELALPFREVSGLYGETFDRA